MRLIDGDELLERMKSYYKFYREHCEPDERSDEMLSSQAEVINSPTIEAIPVRWIYEKYVFEPRHMSIDELLKEWQKYEQKNIKGE